METGPEVLRRRLLLVAAAAVCCAAAPVPSAIAKVYVDPDGPAGQQYALPLDSARGEAAGVPDAGVPGGTTKAPLFGQGIKPSGSKAGQGRDAEPKRQGSGKGGPRPANARNAEVAAASGGDAQTLWVAGLIAAVILLGSAAGLIARRRLPAEPSG